MNWLVWALLSALFAAATAILAKIGVAGVDSNLATAIRTSVVLVFAWLLVGLTTRNLSLAGVSGRTWLFLTLSGIATGLSWLCYFRALQLGPASKVAPVDKLSLVLVIVAAAVFLREPVSLSTAIGGAMVFGGVLVLALA
jgi:transporter family protein